MRYITLLLLLCSFGSWAKVDCTGKISMLSLHLDNGIVIVGLDKGPWAGQICSIQQGGKYNNIAPEVCNALYSSLLAAKAANKNVTLRFMDHSSCTTPELSWKAAGWVSWTNQLHD